MITHIDIEKLLEYKLTPHQFMFLHAVYYKDFSYVLQMLTKKQVSDVRDSLLDTDFIISDGTEIPPNTIISKQEVEKLFGIHVDIVDFDEWYHIYPIKVGSRVLRAVSDTSILYKKHKSKYFKKIKTKEQHIKAIRATEAFIASQKQASKLQFLPNIETVLNNATWETWEALVSTAGEEGKVWNSKDI